MSNQDQENSAKTMSEVVVLTIFKDKNERAVIRQSYRSRKEIYDKIFDDVKSQIGIEREFSDTKGFKKKPPTDLSIHLDGEDDDITFVIELDPCTRAAFGPGPHPIMILPMMLGRDLLSDIALVYKDSKGSTVRMTQNNIPHEYSEVPKKAALSFRCSRSKLIAAWIANVNNAGHPEKNIRIPFFLNLFDTKTGRPVWTYGDEYHRSGMDQGDHGDLDHVDHIRACDGRVHGGIHPQTVAQFFYYP